MRLAAVVVFLALPAGADVELGGRPSLQLSAGYDDNLFLDAQPSGPNPAQIRADAIFDVAPRLLRLAGGAPSSVDAERRLPRAHHAVERRSARRRRGPRVAFAELGADLVFAGRAATSTGPPGSIPRTPSIWAVSTPPRGCGYTSGWRCRRSIASPAAPTPIRRAVASWISISAPEAASRCAPRAGCD